MLRRLWPASYTLRLLYLALLAFVLLSSGVGIAGWLDRLPRLEEMNIKPPPGPQFRTAQGEAWTPGAVGENGFAEVAANGRFVLYADPATSQIAVQDKQSGYLWRSNPPDDRVKQEKAKGLQLENLQSPYILEYVSGTEIRRIQSNSLDSKVKIGYVPIENGLQVTYSYETLSLGFSVQYRLTEAGFELLIPDEGLREEGEMKFYALNPLPYFGAPSGTEEEGYLFVPDGPGGLIHYDRKRPPNIKGYEFAIYGDDPAQLKESASGPKRETIAYPAFGLKRGEEAFAAIVEEGKYNANVKAAPGGDALSYHSISANFTYREEYGRKVSGLTDETVRTVEENRVKTDRRVEYRLLAGEDADYVGMAHAYGQYLEENGLLPEPLQPAEHVPLKLSIIGGGTKAKFGGVRYETATSFKQAEKIVEELSGLGARNLTVNIQGWQNSGRAYTDERFPIAKGMGGTSGARQFVSKMDDRGIPVVFEDFIGWKNPKYSGFTMKQDGIRGIDSTVLQGRTRSSGSLSLLLGARGDFIVNPTQAIRKQKEVIDKLKDIGVDGIHYADGPGNLLFSDYDPDSPLSRADTAHYYQSLLEYTRDQLGMASVYRGNDYALNRTDWVESLPLESSYDLAVDATVPFYPIAVHGFVEYTAAPGNLRNDYEADFLKAVEFGAVPYFEVTHSPSRVLKGTDYEDVYSSEFAIWKDRIGEEYAKFDRLAAVYHQRIKDHEQIADGVFATTYEDGTKVTVDYNTREFSVEGGGAG